MDSTKFTFTTEMALIGPATRAVNCTSGIATGGFLPDGYPCSREILIGSGASAAATTGNIKVLFLNAAYSTAGAAQTIKVTVGERYSWGVTRIYSSGTTVKKIWAFL